ncbi:unnamed protein product [Dicrocoelium dendriticum]|nr:unnamed protein product [Dicrocoelium dendriticum]
MNFQLMITSALSAEPYHFAQLSFAHMLACWGIFDRENFLRRALADSLRRCEGSFYPRWRDYEALQAACHYILDENQCRRDWDNVLAAANQPGGALEQIHIFALSHILRRPILVYGVKYIKNYRDEPIGIANFQGDLFFAPYLRHFLFSSASNYFLFLSEYRTLIEHERMTE